MSVDRIELHHTPPELIVRPVLTVNQAIDLWLNALAAKGRRPRTRDAYQRLLYKFADRFPTTWDVSKVTTDDCEQFIGQWSNRSNGTRAQVHQAVAGLFKWLLFTRRITKNPMEFVMAPVRQRGEDLDVTTIDPSDVPKLLNACDNWREKLCLNILVYLGPRRRAVAMLKLEDYDRAKRMLRFREKGAKTIWKPVPHPLAELLDSAIAAGLYDSPSDYLIPPGKGWTVSTDSRDDRIVWNIVKDVARKAGVRTHVHALRGAFAAFYLEQNPGDAHGLQLLLGHRSFQTTQVYLRRYDKTRAMERVRDLDWSDNTTTPGFQQIADKRFAVSSVAEKEGFEPSFAHIPLQAKASSELCQDSLGFWLEPVLREELQ